MGLSKLSEKCRVCPKVDTCNHKRMEALGYLPEPLAADISAPFAADMVEPIMVKHDYRDVKIAPSVTVTIDLEDIGKELEKELYRSIGLQGLMMG